MCLHSNKQSTVCGFIREMYRGALPAFTTTTLHRLCKWTGQNHHTHYSNAAPSVQKKWEKIVGEAKDTKDWIVNENVLLPRCG